MALPPGFLDELRDCTSLSAVVGRKVTWDLKKSNQAKGDWWAPCPFHQEKTASFHVDDRKGFYYCFGCQAKGNVFTFLTESENMGFMEAVETLARGAGMEMPAQDPRAAEEAKKTRTLAEVMEHAVAYYQLVLSGARGREARAYIESRGLSAATVEHFEIGYASDSRTEILHALKKQGVSESEIVACGLAIKPDDGKAAYDRFRGRIMFPIRDARGRCISFGGRAMDPNARAKYLNGPETELFYKGRSLYNHGPAREAAGKTGRLIVAEGYMDVIALAQAGFNEAVAPLGTAVTQNQLKLIWRIADEPVIALDGDTAGLRAARKVMDLALPALVPGKALRFVMLPQGQDPDDLIRASGPDAFEHLLGESRAMVDLLWEREIEGKNFDSPERRTALDASLRAALGKITDRGLRRHYADAVRERRQALFGLKERRGGFQPRGRGGYSPTPGPTPSARASLLAQAQPDDPEARARVRETAVVWGCLNHPSIAREMETTLERLPFTCSDVARVCDALLGALKDDAAKTSDLVAGMSARLGHDPESLLTAIAQVRLNPYLGPNARHLDARRALCEVMMRQAAVTGVAAEIRDGMDDIMADPRPGLDYRLTDAVTRRDKALRGTTGADQSPAEQEEGLSDQLSRLIDAEIWVKKH